MVKKAKVSKEQDLNKQEALAQENKILRDKIAAMELNRDTMVDVLGGNIANEMRKIRQKGKKSANSTKVTLECDHKNISLWTKYGKRIGPMHPDNAIQTLNRFADIGIMLSADQPTSAQIEAYGQTAEYKDMMAKEKIRRARKDKSLKTGQMEKLANEIAKMSGTTVAAINNILKISEVGKVKS